MRWSRSGFVKGLLWLGCALVSQMSHCALPCKCLLSLTAASCLGCSLHTLRAITFISILTCFPCGMCVLCQSLFSSWSVCGMSVRLQCPSGHGTSASCVPTDPWLFSVSLAGMWLIDASSAQPECLSWFLSWVYIYIYIYNYISLCQSEMPSKKMVTLPDYLKYNYVQSYSLYYVPPG